MSSALPPKPSPTGQRASLLSLPSEIIANIASRFDRTTAKAFALVASRFTIFCEPALWRSLELSLQPNFGERPWNAEPVRDITVGGTGLWPDQDAEIWRHRAAAEMARGMLLSGNARKWGLVKKIRMEIYQDALYSTIAVLDLAAPSLLSLEVLDNPNRWEIEAKDVLDYHLYHRKLPFPSLTHLVLGSGTIFFPGTLRHILNHAPGLISLDVDLDDRQVFDNDLGMRYSHTRNCVEPTQLQRIRYICNSAEDVDPVEGIRVLIHLLEKSRSLKQLTLDFNNEELREFAKLWKVVRGLPELRDLHWELMSQVINDEKFGTSGGFSNLRRLIMDNNDWVDLFSDVIPVLPNLEVIYVPEWGDDAELHLGPGMSYDVDYPYQPQENFSDFDQVHFFASIRQCPKLRAIHILPGVLQTPPLGETNIFTLLNNIEKEDGVMGRINSFRHGNEELVHLRYLLPWESSGSEHAGVTWQLPEHDPRVGTEPVGEPRFTGWRDVLDIDGLEVPASVLQKMRRVEGVAEGAWRGRGIEVGEKGWKVLTDWRSEIMGTSESGGQ